VTERHGGRIWAVVYSAWRLQQANAVARIVVFEGSGHIGGRLLSVRPA
jgi:protoporphyrinogen oxidase